MNFEVCVFHLERQFVLQTFDISAKAGIASLVTDSSRWSPRAPRATHLTPLLEERECLVGKYRIFIIWSEMILEDGPNSAGIQKGKLVQPLRLDSTLDLRGQFQAKLNRADLPLAVISNTNSSEGKDFRKEKINGHPPTQN